MKLIEDLGMKLPNPDCKQKERFGLYECPVCEKNFETRTNSVKLGRSKMCKSCSSKESNKKHGDSKTRLYGVWLAMRQRCNNPKNQAYAYYGGRGIKVFTDWDSSFPKFKEWAIANGYTDRLEIDREDNDIGYQPNNCRFVTRAINCRNTRHIRSTNKSGYRGVGWSNTNGKYFASICVDKKNIHLGYSHDAKDCADMYDNYVKEHNLEHSLNCEQELT